MTGLGYCQTWDGRASGTILTPHVALGRSPMIAVAAGSVDLRKAHRVAGNQACGDVAAVMPQVRDLEDC